MNPYKQAYLRYMDQEGIKYTDEDDRAVSVAYNGDNTKTIRIKVIFDKDDGHTVAFRNWDIGNFKGSDAKYAKGTAVCAEMTAKFRFVKFYLDKDGDVSAEADAVVDMSGVGEICAEMVSRMVGIIDDAYPEFMKALWA